jgi:hypothetical protein
VTEKRNERLERIATRLITQPGSILVPVTITPTKETELARGHHLYISSCCPISPEPTGDVQWVGVHDHLCVTLRRPVSWTSLLQVAKDLPIIEPFGIVTWMGATRQKRLRSKDGGTSFYLRQVLWNPKERVSFKTKGIIYPITVGRFKVYVLDIPAIQREKVVPDYIEEL